MMFVPREIGDKMHDWNANWAFSLNRYDELALERKAEMDKQVEQLKASKRKIIDEASAKSGQIDEAIESLLAIEHTGLGT
jgi:hypothetical protein